MQLSGKPALLGVIPPFVLKTDDNEKGVPGEVFQARVPPAPKPTYPSGKFSGLMFGDYYWYDTWHGDTVSASNSAKPDGQQGFWLRRAYLTYDHTFSATMSARLRMEMNSNGALAGGNLVPFVTTFASPPGTTSVVPALSWPR